VVLLHELVAVVEVQMDLEHQEVLAVVDAELVGETLLELVVMVQIILVVVVEALLNQEVLVVKVVRVW
jgi:hypothetical protein